MVMNTRRASIDDAAEACVVLRRSITELCHLDHGEDTRFLALWLLNKTVENVKRWILESHFFVAEEAGKILGVAAMDESGQITLNYVSPDHRFRGVSKVLMERMEDVARGIGLEACTLESTQTALRFYQDLGYAITGHNDSLPRTGTQAVLTKRLRPPKRSP
jgi:GNAT superfamily N-acetyltransferase